MHSAYLIKWQDEERTSASCFDDDGDELGIDGTEIGIPRIFRDPDVVVALLPSHRLSEHVPVLGVPDDRPERHGGRASR